MSMAEEGYGGGVAPESKSNHQQKSGNAVK